LSPSHSVAGQSPLTGNWRKFALAAVLTGYFAWFNWGSLRVHFAIDDMANIGHYFDYSIRQMVLSNFLPWRGDSRPMGGLFYIPIYHFAGLNPVPYQAVLLLILLANVYWAYRLVRLLGGGELAAALVALACCYHGGIGNLYYNAAFVFDALCCFFYLACFVYYLRIRNRGQLPGLLQTIAFLAIFLCALNSKEMAVSVPVMLLVYEWTYHPPAVWTWAELLAWVRGSARTSLIAAVLTLMDIYGKVAVETAMIKAEGYRPVFTLERFHSFQVNLFQDLFFSWAWIPGWGQIIGTWALLAFLAWRRADRPILRFLFWFLVVVPLPIEFLPGKREACFALLMIGGAIFLAVVFVDAIEWLAGFLSRELKLPPPGRRLLVGAMTAVVVLIWVRDQRHLREQIGGDPMTTLGFETWDIIQQLRASSFRPRPGSSVAFLDDPYHSLDMYFLGRLWFHDRSVTVHVTSMGPLSPEELAKMDYVFTIENRKLIRVR
jgi:hypothetical protein